MQQSLKRKGQELEKRVMQELESVRAQEKLNAEIEARVSLAEKELESVKATAPPKKSQTETKERDAAAGLYNAGELRAKIAETNAELELERRKHRTQKRTVAAELVRLHAEHKELQQVYLRSQCGSGTRRTRRSWRSTVAW